MSGLALDLGVPFERCGATQAELEKIDGGGGYGTYIHDGQRYADRLNGTLIVRGTGKDRRYWIRLPGCTQKFR